MDSILSNPLCDIDNSWAVNSLNQAPCEVANIINGGCNPAANVTQKYTPPDRPTIDMQGPCLCSTIMYSLVSACIHCKTRGKTKPDTWSHWKSECVSQYVHEMSYPVVIPHGTEVPGWAYLNVVATNSFDAVQSHQYFVDHLPQAVSPPSESSTETPSSSPSPGENTSQSSTETPSSSPSPGENTLTRSKPKVQVPAIAGGVGAGFVLLSLLVLLILRRRRRRDTRAVVIDPHVNTLMDDELHQTSTEGQANRKRNPYNNPYIGDLLTLLPGGKVAMSAGRASESAILLSNMSPSSLAESSSMHSSPSQSGAQMLNAELRRERHAQLQRQVRQINRELRDLTSEAAGRRASTIKGGQALGWQDVEEVDPDMEELKQQIKMLREQNMLLQSQQDSPWAQGLSDEPPPGYTPEPAEQRR